MAPSSIQDIPQFKHIPPPEFPWSNCTKGSEEHTKKYALLARLGIPLGETEADINCRRNILSSLINFEESCRNNYKHELISSNNQKSRLVRIPALRKTGQTDAEKVNVLIRKRPRVVDLILECLCGGDAKKVTASGTSTASTSAAAAAATTASKTTTTTSSNGEDDENVDEGDNENKEEEDPDMTKEDAAGLLCWYFAKNYTGSFMKHVEMAQEIEKKQNKAKERAFVPPPNVVMFDGGDINNPAHVLWNVRYQELMDYREIHGDCLVPSRKSKAFDTEYAELSNWVSTQRSNKKYYITSLTPKRIELLDALDFVWLPNANHYNSVKDPRFHRAVAAKLFFDQQLTAHDAMIMCGFPEEESSNDSRKKLLNGVVCNFNKKNLMIREQVLDLIKTLRDAVEKGTLDTVVAEIYGESEMLVQLSQQGKLVPRSSSEEDEEGGGTNQQDEDEDEEDEEPGSKRQRTDDGGNNAVNHQKRLPFASLKDDSAWL